MKTLLALAASILLSIPATHALTRDEQRAVDLLTAASRTQAVQVNEILNFQQKEIGPACAPLSSIKPVNLTVITTPEFDLDGMPRQGTWQVQYEVRACGALIVRSVLFKAEEVGARPAGVASAKEGVGKIGLQSMEPGQTLADPELRKDVVKSLLVSAERAAPTCKAFVVKDSKVLERPTHAKDKWRELWHVAVCPQDKQPKQDFLQVVSFYPSPMGTLFRMSLPPAGGAPATKLGK